MMNDVGVVGVVGVGHSVGIFGVGIVGVGIVRVDIVVVVVGVDVGIVGIIGVVGVGAASIDNYSSDTNVMTRQLFFHYF